MVGQRENFENNFRGMPHWPFWLFAKIFYIFLYFVFFYFWKKWNWQEWIFLHFTIPKNFFSLQIFQFTIFPKTKYCRLKIGRFRIEFAFLFEKISVPIRSASKFRFSPFSFRFSKLCENFQFLKFHKIYFKLYSSDPDIHAWTLKIFIFRIIILSF